MLQFNLLPDVKKDYIKSKRQKHMIFTVSLIAAASAVGITILLFSYVQFGQKEYIKDLTKDINSEISAIRSIEDLDKILTIQSQLETLPQLHQAKPESSRIFSYLTQLTPADVKIKSINIDIVNQTMTIEGDAPSLASINRYADTLKFSKYKATPKSVEESEEETADNSPQEVLAFSDVLTELSRSEESSSYSISLIYDPTIFDNTYDVVMIVPEIVTTRSTQGKPEISDQSDNPLFEGGGDE